MVCQLLRFKENSKGCPGVFLLNGEWLVGTFEPDSKDTERFQIPVGIHYCYRVPSVKFKETFEVRVPGHSLIRFHWGNKEKDTTACILTGFTKGINAIWNSKKAFEYFMRRLEGVDNFMLEVIQWKIQDHTG